MKKLRTHEPWGSVAGSSVADSGAVVGDQAGRFPPTAWALTTVESRRGVLRRAMLGVAGLGLAGLAAGCGADGADDGDDRGQSDAPVTGVTEVAVRDNYFEPAAIEVPVGARVTWRWEGDNPHNVVGDGFESEIQTEGTFANVFAEPGRHEYRCTLHGGMRGEVFVTEVDSS